MKTDNYIVNGRQFRNQTDYAKACRDQKLIEKLKLEVNLNNLSERRQLIEDIKNEKYVFMTILGVDFLEELEGMGEPVTPVTKNKTSHYSKEQLEKYAIAELKKTEKKRRIFIALCSVIGCLCLGYFGYYVWDGIKTDSQNEKLNKLKETPLVVQQVTPSVAENADEGPLYTLDSEKKEREVLDEYKNLLITNKKLIGWLKIDDTNIDYPVVQTSDNEYYLTHNMNQEYDKNGTIFMDKDCDVLKPSTNFIVYGHHMKSGKMFGKLDQYQNEEFYKTHSIIHFDTIYEKGEYEVMYVFRSKVYKEDVITFKYYQFIDANGETEFDSYMNEMAALSLYDTGVTATYGDQLLTLSTCDYQEENGRFVVVAKKIKE